MYYFEGYTFEEFEKRYGYNLILTLKGKEFFLMI